MECTEKSPCRTQLSKSIADKIEVIAKLRTELEDRKKTIGTSLDDQLVVAELEYRVVKEEMSLLNLQEQHWESAARWDVPPHTPDIQRELCEVLHSYIVSVREKGGVPALHAVERPSSTAPENSVLISQGGGNSIPRVEWAHHSTELQPGDRLLEVNGHLVIGRDPSDVSRILGRPLCRVVFLRPLSPNQALRGAGGLRETSNLRHELTAVVSRLNREMAEKARLAVQNKRIQTDNSDLKTQNRKLKLQVLSLQSILIYLYQSLEKTPHLLLQGESPSTPFDMLRNMALEEHCSVLCSGALKDALSIGKKSIPWLELKPQLDGSNATEHESEDHR